MLVPLGVVHVRCALLTLCVHAAQAWGGFLHRLPTTPHRPCSLPVSALFVIIGRVLVTYDL